MKDLTNEFETIKKEFKELSYYRNVAQKKLLDYDKELKILLKTDDEEEAREITSRLDECSNLGVFLDGTDDLYYSLETVYEELKKVVELQKHGLPDYKDYFIL